MKRPVRRYRRTLVALLWLVAWGCGSEERQTPEARKSTLTESERVMRITSSGFEDNAKLDAKYTVEGQDVSPPISWSDVPPETKSFALICDDPDAPSPRRPGPDPWVHWLIFNIPADLLALPQGIGHEPEPEQVPGARQGVNSWPSDNVGYRGPAPPPGSGTHRYFFKLYALDSMLELGAGATKKQLLEAMSGHILGEGQLVGTYER
jgi:Raf kinase inhibitor-like YbhB/YbcL family protein